AAAAPPVGRTLGPGGQTPRPARLAPQLAASVAAVVHEAGELRLRDGAPRDAEGTNLDRVRPLLVVEDERLAGIRSHQERPARNSGVALDGSSLGVAPIDAAGRRRVAEGLPRVGERLVV